MIVPRAELKQALSIANQIPGLYRQEEAAFLYRLARRRGNLVELGCWMGRTTAIMLQAAAIWGADLTTVDAFTPMPNQRKAATPIRWRANLKKVGLKPPKLLVMTTDEAAEVYSKEQNISFLFIDAAHGRDAVSADLANWTPRIKLGGVVALHDMFFPSITGVCQAVIDWWCVERDDAGAKWEILGLRDYTIAFKRKRW
jgi:predicted O-methyltransferase YrrM